MKLMMVFILKQLLGFTRLREKEEGYKGQVLHAIVTRTPTFNTMIMKKH